MRDSQSIRTEDLIKHYGGIKSVNGISINFNSAKITGLIGPNGSGKSTLVDLLSGVIAPDEGWVTVGSLEKVKKLIPNKNYTYKISRTFQDVKLFEHMTVKDNLLVVMTKRGIIKSLFERSTKQYESQLKLLLETVDLLDKSENFVSELSYGQRKLLGVVRALAMDADIYFFDEPLSGLSPAKITTIKRILTRLRSEGKTVVLIDHNIDFVKELADHMIVLSAGKVLLEGKPDYVVAHRGVIDAYIGT